MCVCVVVVGGVGGGGVGWGGGVASIELRLHLPPPMLFNPGALIHNGRFRSSPKVSSSQNMTQTNTQHNPRLFTQTTEPRQEVFQSSNEAREQRSTNCRSAKFSPLKTTKFSMSCLSISQAASAGHDLDTGALNITQTFFSFFLYTTPSSPPPTGSSAQRDGPTSSIRVAKRLKTCDVERPGRRMGERAGSEGVRRGGRRWKGISLTKGVWLEARGSHLIGSAARGTQRGQASAGLTASSSLIGCWRWTRAPLAFPPLFHSPHFSLSFEK